jgi:transcription termination factor Rho
MPLDIGSLRSQSIAELIQTARASNVENPTSLRKHDLVAAILRESGAAASDGTGVLEILPDGFGFLRAPEYSFLPGSDDVYVSPSQIRRFNLRTGDLVGGQVRAPKDNERYFALIKVERVNGESPDVAREKVLFENLTPIWPHRRITLGGGPLRLVDLLAPLGFGQRALVVGPPRSGRSTLVRTLAHAITRAHPGVHLIVVLVAERPEEVTDTERSVPGAVLATTFDEPDSRHVQVAEMAVERGKRLVEHRKDVVVVFDSLDRFAQASGNGTAPLDAAALLRVRRVLGAARELSEGGSLTLLATADSDGPVVRSVRDAANAEIVLASPADGGGGLPALDLAGTGTLRAERLRGPAEQVLAARARAAGSIVGAVHALDNPPAPGE